MSTIPLRGESIGTAYIKVVADATGLPEEVRHQLEDNDAVEGAGARAGERYSEGFAKQLEDHNGKSLHNALTDALSKDDALSEFFEGQGWKDFEQDMKAEFGGLGTNAANELRDKFTKAGSLDGIEKSVSNVVRKINADVDEMIRASKNAAEAAGRSLENLAKDSDDVEKSTKRGKNALQDMGAAMSTLSEKISFGKGSRNDFINFLGSFIVGINKAVATIPTLLGNLQALPGALKDASAEGESLFSTLSKTFSSGAEGGESGLIGLIADGPAGIIAIAAAFQVLIVILGPIAALISGIAAAITALLGSLAFAAVGVLAPLAGLVAPIAISLGVVVAGLLSMNKEAKKTLLDGIKPLIDGFKELGVQARTGFLSGFKVDSDGVAEALKQLNPLVHATAVAIGQASASFIDGFKSENFDHFVDAMTTFVPHAVASLSKSFSNLSGAIGNIFIDLIPSTNTFLQYVERITREFEDFTKSAKGKKEILNFLDEAATSAQAVGGFLEQAVGFLLTLLDAGKGTGDSIFTSLGDQIGRWTDSLKPTGGKTVFDEQVGGIKNVNDAFKKTPKKDPLAGFFANGKQVAHDLGQIALELGEIFDTLDSPEARTALHNILRITDDLFKMANAGAEVSNFFTTTFIDATKAAFAPVGQSADFAKKKIKEFGHFLSTVDFSNGIRSGSIGAAIVAWIPGAHAKILNFAGNVAGYLLRPFTEFAASVGGIITGAISGVARVIRGLPDRLSGVGSALGTAAEQWAANILAPFGNLPTQIKNEFEGLGAEIAAAIGDVIIHIGVSDPTGILGKLGKGLGDLVHHAAGGITNGPEVSVIGEAGREAVVPLDRPLSQVDPSVRWLAAIAQGKNAQGVGSTTLSPGKSLSVVQHITTPTTNVRGVAAEVVNQLVAAGYGG